MATKRALFKRKRALRRRGGLRRRAAVPRMRRANGVPEWASLTESMSMKVPGPFPITSFSSNVMYSLYNLSLSQFTRAQAVAQNYQYFRMKQVTITIKPLFDTFQQGQASVLPYLYYLIDKNGNCVDYRTTGQLKASGAVPRRLDDKSVIITYRPSVLEAVADDGTTTQFNRYRISPWLSTNDRTPLSGGFVPSGVNHYGLKWTVESSGPVVGYTIDMKVEFQFKKALIIPQVEEDVLEQVEIFPVDRIFDPPLSGPEIPQPA